MKNQIIRLMLTTAIFAVTPALAMDEERNAEPRFIRIPDPVDDNQDVLVPILPRPQLLEIDAVAQNGAFHFLPFFQNAFKYLICGGIGVGIVYIIFVNPIVLGEVFHLDKIFNLSKNTWHFHRP